MEIPKRLGKYKIEELLGHGSMGAVLRAVQKTLGRTVALKVLPPELAEEDPVKKKRFATEAKITARLFHPSIPTVYHMGRSKGMAYIAMQFIEGEPLDDAVKKGIGIPELVKVFAQVASALAIAHEHGVIHRDLKPGNIQLDREGNAHLLDFGIAKDEEGRDLTEHGVIVGSPLYMSPEQARGETVDGRSDIFSLGCAMYRLLTGEKPFKAENKRELLLDRMKLHRLPDHRLPPPVHKIAPHVPRPLSRIIEKCMKPSREHRYQSAAELYEDLETLRVLLASEEPEKDLSRFSFLVSTKLPFSKILGPLIAALLVLLSGIFFLLHQRSESLRPQPATFESE
ncbi:MAG: serine/threonine protein kinase [Planctomycetes bacterium]|nr:serine/threonine protein kinase [Planctomycetota bacterium]